MGELPAVLGNQDVNHRAAEKRVRSREESVDLSRFQEDIETPRIIKDPFPFKPVALGSGLRNNRNIERRIRQFPKEIKSKSVMFFAISQYADCKIATLDHGIHAGREGATFYEAATKCACLRFPGSESLVGGALGELLDLPKGFRGYRRAETRGKKRKHPATIFECAQLRISLTPNHRCSSAVA
jgi:hypothetical protein